jgi:alpha-beta hydrolase superfamily lysophospholipase
MDAGPVRLELDSPGVRVAVYRWDPAVPVRAVVQLTHGMGEHALRYADVARALTDQGYVVYAQDHRGHGATAASDDVLGQIGADGWTELVNDIGRLSALARSEQPTGVPLVVLGHSMGSFACQQYVLDRSGDLDALILTGTAAIDLLEPALDLDAPMDLSAFNAAFEPARTDYDWLSRDEEQVDRYVADPRCGFGLDPAGSKAMFVAARRLTDPAQLGGIRKDLPVYIGVGENDPVNGQLALSQALVDRLQGAGLTDVTYRVYAGARHEILNETNRDEVVRELLAWLDRVVPPRPREA